MSDASNNHEHPASAGPDGGVDASDLKSLAHIESPGIVPAGPGSIHDEATKADAAVAEPATPYGRPDQRTETAGAAHSQGTALILAPVRPKAEAPEAEPIPTKSPQTFRLRWVAAMVVGAAAVGGIAGSLATAGVSYLTASPAEPPPYYAALSEALGRVDRELTALKTGAETSAKTGQQVAKIAERVERAEKAEVEAGTKLAKATEAVDRLERRLAIQGPAMPSLAPGPAAQAGDVTGAIADPHATAAPPAGLDMKRAPMGPVIEGWVVRDVYNGAAMIQNRAGVIQVIPGDVLPGLGRIEQVRRQDGRWMVVTSRGLIVSR